MFRAGLSQGTSAKDTSHTHYTAKRMAGDRRPPVEHSETNSISKGMMTAVVVAAVGFIIAGDSR